jgi:glycine cleavage system aminomethyltransferase T
MRVEDTPYHVTGFEKFVELDQEQDVMSKGELRRILEGNLLDRKLVGIEIGGAPMTDEGALNDFWPLLKGDTRLGRITAGAWSPHLEKHFGYAWVPVRWIEPGSTFDTDSARGRLAVTVAELPFVDPGKDIPKS